MKFSGNSICKGIAIGRLYCNKHYSKDSHDIYSIESSETQKANPDEQVLRFLKAKRKSIHNLTVLYRKALEETDEETASVFEGHKMILEDNYFTKSVSDMIFNEKMSAEYACTKVCTNMIENFQNSDDPSFQAKAEDIKNIMDSVLDNLEQSEKIKEPKEPYILMSKEVSPEEFVKLDKRFLKGIVVTSGSSFSHTAILAKALNLPMLTNVVFSEELDGKKAILDTGEGNVIISPTDDELSLYNERLIEEKKHRELLEKFKGQRGPIKVYANINETFELSDAIDNDAEGIGLFRSEFMYISGQSLPDEELQFEIYKHAILKLRGKKLVIRTMDIGADKQVKCISIPKEENAQLGMRGIRVSFVHEDIFRTQLRAIIRASYFGDISIMYPMITACWEVEKAKKIVSEIIEEFDQRGVPYGKLEQGIMVETPAAVMISDELAKLVDFFSIGTNDLIQYTLVADRQNESVSQYIDEHHDAVMRMIRLTVENGHKEGIKVGICGELAADVSVLDQFIEMQVDELSVAVPSILEVRSAMLAQSN